MQPTIEPGDTVRIELGEPSLVAADRRSTVVLNRGDIAAFVTPRWPNAVIVFRLIGLPGETVSVFDEEVLINGTPLLHEDAGSAPSEPSYYVENPAPNWQPYNDARFVLETLPNGISYRTLHQRREPDNSFRSRQRRSRRDFVIPNDNLFLLGDSRDVANDSRFEVGMVPLSQVVGKMVDDRT